MDLPEKADVGKSTDEAIKAIEEANPELKDILPRGHQKLERSTLIELLRLFAPLPTQLEGDAFGFIYEDFLSNFAAQEGNGLVGMSERVQLLGGSLQARPAPDGGWIVRAAIPRAGVA